MHRCFLHVEDNKLLESFIEKAIIEAKIEEAKIMLSIAEISADNEMTIRCIKKRLRGIT